MYRIPFNKPFVIGRELYYIAQAVEMGHLAGDGEFTKRCHALLESRFHARKVLLTHSCTAALEMAAILSGVGPGDEVLMPSYTFVSTANAFALHGATIRFVDIREDTLNINEELIEEAITPRTKVIVPVHYAGVACEMDKIMRIAENHDLLVVEDAAQGVNASYRGRYLGTMGHLGCYSFHETKNLISGEGGALLVNAPIFIERAEIIREKGTDRSRFFRGEVDKYSWVDVGSSYLPSELVAAFLCAQLEECDRITHKRLQIWQWYNDLLQPIARSGQLRLPVIPPECTHNGHMFYTIASSSETRSKLIAGLKQRAVQAIFHYVPLHTSPCAQRLFGSDIPDLPVTEDLASRLLRLPCYFDLSRDQVEEVVDAVADFFA